MWDQDARMRVGRPLGQAVMRLILPILLALALVLPGMALAAEKPPIEVEADSLDHDDKRGVVIATGNVKITQYPSLELYAERAIYHPNSKRIQAWGNVLLFRGKDVFKAERVDLDTDRNEGTFEPLAVDLDGPGQKIVAASGIRHDEFRFTLYDATMTNCDCEENHPWEVRANRVRIDLEANKATANHVVLYIRRIPVLYSPWWEQPIKKVRKTGLLIPSVRFSSKEGFQYEQPFYWNIAPDQDATFTANYIQERGTMGKAQYRYLRPEFQGIVNLHGIYDTSENDDPTEGRIKDEDELRGLLTWDHRTQLGNWRINWDVERVRTDDYMDDYDQNLIDDSQRFLESRLLVDRYWPHQAGGATSFTGDAVLFQDLNAENNYRAAYGDPKVTGEDPDDRTVHVLPNLTLSDSRPVFGPVTDFSLDSYLNFVNYQQLGGQYTKRGTASSSLNYTRPTSFGSVFASTGAQETAYWMDQETAAGARMSREATVNSGYVQLRLEGLLQRVYRFRNYDREMERLDNASLRQPLVVDLDDPPRQRRASLDDIVALKHTIEPLVQYVGVAASMDQDDQDRELPNFDSGMMEISTSNIFDRSVFSGGDRVGTGNWLAYGLRSNLYGRMGYSGEIRRLASFLVGQRWYPQASRNLDEARESFSDIAAEFQVTPSDAFSAVVGTRIDPYERYMEQSHFQAIASSPAGDNFTITYYYQRAAPDAIATEQVEVSGQLILTDKWRFTWDSNYSINEQRAQEWTMGLAYVDDCWEIHFSANRNNFALDQGRAPETVYGVFITLRDLGSYQTKAKMRSEETIQ